MSDRAPAGPDSFEAVLFEDRADADALAVLLADPVVERLDTLVAQRRALAEVLRAGGSHGDGDGDHLGAEPARWAYYPWRRTLVRVLGPRAFRRVRLDRNRNLVTAAEQDRLGRLRIGVVGLSSGHVIAHTLAAQGLCGELRLADFDELELANLNRVPAGVLDLGLNKATATARRIAELDPYLTVRPWPNGVTADTVHDFVDGLDVVVEQCDSLDVKALVRQVARERGVPVVMATSDRAMIDVERFDTDPDYPVFHGLLGDVDVAALRALDGGQRVAYVLRLLDVAGLADRSAASLLEVGHELATWPQLAGDVTLGAGAVTEAVRRIGLGLPLTSGRVCLDAGAALDRLERPRVPAGTAAEPPTSTAAEPPTSTAAEPPTSPAAEPPSAGGAEDPHGSIGTFEAMAAAANRAPSGGNSQPWSIEVRDDALVIAVEPTLTSAMDIGFRGSAVAVGAAVFNAQAAAGAAGRATRVRYDQTAASPLRATVHLAEGTDARRARWYPAVWRRETNRHLGTGAALDGAAREELVRAAEAEGGGLCLVTDRDRIAVAADVLGASDRIRYLTPRLHAEMMSELRWPVDAETAAEAGIDTGTKTGTNTGTNASTNTDMDTGIDVRSLELDPVMTLALDVLKRSEVMAALASWDGGRILGVDTWARVSASSALAVVTVDGDALTDYARGGAAVEAVWLAAQEAGLSVHPVSPAFLYARSSADVAEVVGHRADDLVRLRDRFADVAELGAAVPALILRLAVTAPTTTRSRRRSVNAFDRRYSVGDVRRSPSSQP